MQVQKLNDSVYYQHGISAVNDSVLTECRQNNASQVRNNALAKDTVSFRANAGNAGKKFKMFFGKLCNYMKEPSEMTNAAIAAIGTGIIAPFAIMCSPSKKTNEETDKKAAKEKKKFQAIRQPVSAALAFGFQVPTTIGISKALKNLAYEKHLKLFDDEILGQLIPDKKYLKKQARKILDGKADILLQDEWAQELQAVRDHDAVTNGLTEKLRKEYSDYKYDIPEDKLKRMANDRGKRLEYIAEQMAKKKHGNLLDAKVRELADKEFNITELDIVTEGYQGSAKVKFPEEFAELRKNANLTWLDKVVETMGFSNKKLSELAKKEKALAQEKGLELMKKDINDGNLADVFNDNSAKLRNFIENRIGKSQKLYNNKIFWLTLVTNLFMVAISCVALNWLHPKFAKFIENIQNKKETKNSENKEIEVRA